MNPFDEFVDEHESQYAMNKYNYYITKEVSTSEYIYQYPLLSKGIVTFYHIILFIYKCVNIQGIKFKLFSYKYQYPTLFR